MEEKLPVERIKRKVLMKKESETSEEHGLRPEERSVDELLHYGIINLNKPYGPTSHQVSDYVKNILNVKKAGHSGTLDPHVTGVLPIALERATRIVEVLLKAGKEYVGVMHLHGEVDSKKIEKDLIKFSGKIKQIPPVRSAVKRVEREREIYYFNILEIEGKDVLFKVGCEAGTYIRKLVDDFGKNLGVGAHMTELVRTKVAFFKDEDWINLYDLKDSYELYKEGDSKAIKKCVLNIEKGVEHLAKIWVLDSSVDSLCHGANLNLPGISKVNSDIKEENIVAVMSLKDELICLGIAKMSSEEIIKEDNGFAVKTEKVFMERGVYPKFKKNEVS